MQFLSCSITAFVNQTENTSLFSTLFSFSRIAQGLGSIGIQTANYSIMIKCFPDEINKAVGLIEAMSGIGMVMGPAIGSALYSLGGFSLPFYFCASVFLIVSLLVYQVIPSSIETTETNQKISTKVNYWTLMKN